MSYILEAIKRSERQRLNAGAGGLRALPVFVEAARRPPRLLYGAASAALIAAGIAIGWLRPWQAGHTAAAPLVTTLAPDAGAPTLGTDLDAIKAAPPPPLTMVATEKTEVLHIIKVKPYRPAAHQRAPVLMTAQRAPVVAPATEPATAAPTATPTSAALRPAAPDAAAQLSEAAANTAASAPVPATTVATLGSASPRPAPREDNVLALYELPPEILHNIPPMSITGFTYSDVPQGRMVDINDRLLQEGQYVADGLKLERITPDGLIFSYRHYRFRKNVR